MYVQLHRNVRIESRSTSASILNTGSGCIDGGKRGRRKKTAKTRKHRDRLHEKGNFHRSGRHARAGSGLFENAGGLTFYFQSHRGVAVVSRMWIFKHRPYKSVGGSARAAQSKTTSQNPSETKGT